MNPSTACARVVVDELLRGGVREAVLAPGSRSAPLAYALHDAELAGRLRLHVRVDERSAGFLALGLAKVSRLPVPVVTTSGTAAVHLHAAVLEAHHSGVPLVALTADRPAELVGTGANQTTEQAGLYGDAVRLDATAHAGLLAGSGAGPTWRSLVCRALAAASGRRGDPGPVHLNVALPDPLVPDPPVWAAAQPLSGDLAGRPDGAPWVEVDPVGPRTRAEPPEPADPMTGGTLLLVGDGPPSLVAAAHTAGTDREWPVVAEPTGWGPRSLPHGPLLLADLPDHLRPARVVVVGRPTLSRAVQALLADPRARVELVPAGSTWADPSRTADAVHAVSWLTGPGRTGSREFRTRWEAYAAAAGAALTPVVDDSWPSGPSVARAVAAAVPGGSLLLLGSSNPVRDVDLAATPRADLAVVANRGLAGIDGTVSTVVGAALAHGGPSYALVGDLTFLHDANGLLIGAGEPRPDLTLVVVNDDGGGIFTLLEHGDAAYAGAFERVLGTPTGADLGALCQAYGVAHQAARTRAELAAALSPAPGLRVVEVRVPRADRRRLAAAMHDAVAAVRR